MDKNIKFPTQITINESYYMKFAEIFKATQTKRFSQNLAKQQRDKKDSAHLFINDIYCLCKNLAEKDLTHKQLRKRIEKIEEVIGKVFKNQNIQGIQIEKCLKQLVQIYSRYYRLTSLISDLPKLNLENIKQKIDDLSKDQRQKQSVKNLINYKTYEAQFTNLQKVRNKLQDQLRSVESVIVTLQDIEQFGIINGKPYYFQPTSNQRLNKQLKSFINYLSNYTIQFDKFNFASDFMGLLINKQKTYQQKEKKFMQLQPIQRQFISPCFQLFKQTPSKNKFKTLLTNLWNKKDNEPQSQTNVNKQNDNIDHELKIIKLNSEIQQYRKKDKQFSRIFDQNNELKMKLKNANDRAPETYCQKCQNFLANQSCILQNDDENIQKLQQKQDEKYSTLLKQKQNIEKQLSLSRSNQIRISKNAIQLQVNLKKETIMVDKLLKQYDEIVQQNKNIRNKNQQLKQQYQNLQQRFRSLHQFIKGETIVKEQNVEQIIPKIKQVKLPIKSSIFVESDDQNDEIYFFAKQQEKRK